MSKFVDFVRKTLGDDQGGGKDDEKSRGQRKIEQRIENEVQKARKQFEFELLEKYRDHRLALQDYQEKLAARELELSGREEQLLLDQGELDERQKVLKDAIKTYTTKKKKELHIEAEKAKDKAKADLEALRQYEGALHRTELRCIDWLKRVDRREREAFEEIRKDVEEYRESNQSPPEDGVDFERQFAVALKKHGYENVEVTKESGDFGADILAEKDGVRYVIQCKYYTTSVGVKAVQQVFASKIHYAAHVAVVATNSVFTKSAKVLAEETGVILWNGLKVQEMMND